MGTRLLDLVVSTALLIVFGPVILAIAVLIRLDSSGPAFWLSERVGKDDFRFRPYRFRTMAVGPSDGLSAEQRLTRVGRFVRNYSLDHLPTLINVLKGEMSLVGPRPEAPGLVDMTDPTWQTILSVRPGLISPAVLRLAREYNASSQAVRNALEREYVENRSLAYDLRLLVTAARALAASGGNVKARGQPWSDLHAR
ncbi:MAG: sugar transferase [Anaerolineae bacterium]|nr:sugar transferase [Anaerolineae bacterium]